MLTCLPLLRVVRIANVVFQRGTGVVFAGAIVPDRAWLTFAFDLGV